MTQHPTQEQLKTLFSYDPAKGTFTRIQARRGSKVGEIAGSVGSSGYLQVRVDGKLYLAARLGWLYVNGCWPKQFLDHIDGDRLNNRIENLREASPTENSRNAKIRKDNTTGFKGVSLFKRSGRYAAVICDQGKNHFLGHFNTPEEAGAAYVNAARELHGEFVRGDH